LSEPSAEIDNYYYESDEEDNSDGYTNDGSTSEAVMIVVIAI
jgi:hypothetical protein